LDTPADTDDLVLAELRKLREGVGLSAARLERSGNVMSALAASDPEVALTRLLGFLTELGEGDRTRALRVDFGLDLPALLGREPHARERDWLGDRRSGYAEVVGRDVKTVGRWSDRALAELRAKLLTDQFTGHLFVVAAVDGDRILGTTTIQRADDDGELGPETHASTSYDNPSQEPSLPALIYGIPRDWRPASLTLAVVFRSTPYPTSIWAVVAPDFFQVSYGGQRYPVELAGDAATCRIVKPRADRIYAVEWA
jgi:hypothetical protein